MAPGLDNPGEPPPAAGGRSRTPEEIRTMLSSYSSGLERGRRMAGGATGVRRNGNGSAGGGPIDDHDGTGEPL
jgi:hypothetical protein